MNIIDQIIFAKQQIIIAKLGGDSYPLGSFSYLDNCKFVAKNLCSLESLIIFYQIYPKKFHDLKIYQLIDKEIYRIITDAAGPL